MSYIMIVDDDNDLAEATALVLKSDGHEIGFFDDTESAFEGFMQRQPDLVLLDVMFPGSVSGGFEMARKIAGVTRDVPILMLTAINSHFQHNFSASDIEETWLPITEFLEKPVNFTALRKTVTDLIQKKKNGTALKEERM